MQPRAHAFPRLDRGTRGAALELRATRAMGPGLKREGALRIERGLIEPIAQPGHWCAKRSERSPR